jgi:hypothetical protein
MYPHLYSLHDTCLADSVEERLMPQRERILGPIARGPDRAAIRGEPAYRIEEEVTRRVAALARAGSIDPQWRVRMARALRHQRRAARRGGLGYDLLRHLALLRIARGMRRRQRSSAPPA